MQERRMLYEPLVKRCDRNRMGVTGVAGISPGFVNTELANHIKDDTARAAIKEKASRIAISPDAIAEAVVYAIGQPENVDVGEIVVRPSVQD